MAWCFLDAKPLSDPMLTYCELDPLEYISVEFNHNLNIFIQENAFENVVRKLAAILPRHQYVKMVLVLDTLSHEREELHILVIICWNSFKCTPLCTGRDYINGLAQDYSNSSALTMELLQSCAKPSIYLYIMDDIQLSIIILTWSLSLEYPWHQICWVRWYMRFYHFVQVANNQVLSYQEKMIIFPPAQNVLKPYLASLSQCIINETFTFFSCSICSVQKPECLHPVCRCWRLLLWQP